MSDIRFYRSIVIWFFPPSRSAFVLPELRVDCVAQSGEKETTAGHCCRMTLSGFQLGNTHSFTPDIVRLCVCVCVCVFLSICQSVYIYIYIYILYTIIHTHTHTHPLLLSILNSVPLFTCQSLSVSINLSLLIYLSLISIICFACPCVNYIYLLIRYQCPCVCECVCIVWLVSAEYRSLINSNWIWHFISRSTN